MVTYCLGRDPRARVPRPAARISAAVFKQGTFKANPEHCLSRMHRAPATRKQRPHEGPVHLRMQGARATLPKRGAMIQIA